MTNHSKQRRIVLFGLFGQGNLGNDATLLVTLQELRRRLGTVEVLCACSALPSSAEAFDIRLVPLDPLKPKGVWRISNRQLRYVYCTFAYLVTEPWRRWRMRQYVQGTNELIIVGTGVLDDFGMLPWDLPAWLFRWTLCSRKGGAEVKFLAVGAGPIRNRLNRWLMLRAVRMAQIRTYRDTNSRDFLKAHRIDTKIDQVVPDVVFGISAEHLPAPDTSGDTVVGVGVMGYYGWRNEPSLGESTYQEYIRRISLFVDWLLDQGHSVRLLIGELPADTRAVEDVMITVAQNRGAAPVNLTAPTIESLEDLLEAIAGCGTVVASRYHNVICALRLGRPVVALGYSEKFDALMRDAGLTSYCRNIDDFDPDELSALFTRMLENRDELEKSIRQTIEKYGREVSAVFDLMFAKSS